MSEARKEIAFEVVGRPPTKNEARSLLAATHPHAGLVRALLQATHLAIPRDGWTEVGDDIGLELIIRGPSRPPSDATNYLGGVGDVLQSKRTPHNIDLGHLGELQQVSLFTNDRQIREVHYSEQKAATPSYLVRIWMLDTSYTG